MTAVPEEHYIAPMWFALVAGGPLGVVAVRLADGIPAGVFGFQVCSPPTASTASG